MVAAYVFLSPCQFYNCFYLSFSTFYKTITVQDMTKPVFVYYIWNLWPYIIGCTHVLGNKSSYSPNLSSRCGLTAIWENYDNIAVIISWISQANCSLFVKNTPGILKYRTYSTTRKVFTSCRAGITTAKSKGTFSLFLNNVSRIYTTHYVLFYPEPKNYMFFMTADLRDILHIALSKIVERDGWE